MELNNMDLLLSSSSSSIYMGRQVLQRDEEFHQIHVVPKYDLLPSLGMIEVMFIRLLPTTTMSKEWRRNPASKSLVGSLSVQPQLVDCSLSLSWTSGTPDANLYWVGHCSISYAS